MRQESSLADTAFLEQLLNGIADLFSSTIGSEKEAIQLILSLQGRALALKGNEQLHERPLPVVQDSTGNSRAVEIQAAPAKRVALPLQDQLAAPSSTYSRR
jgi:hypothetical protein